MKREKANKTLLTPTDKTIVPHNQDKAKIVSGAPNRIGDTDCSDSDDIENAKSVCLNVNMTIPRDMPTERMIMELLRNLRLFIRPLTMLCYALPRSATPFRTMPG